MDGTYLSAQEVADRLNLSRQVILRMAREGRLKGFQVSGEGRGNPWRFEETDVETFIASRKAQERPHQ